MPNAAPAASAPAMPDHIGPAGFAAPFTIREITKGRKRRPLEERFWEKVKRGEPMECWEWQSAKNSKGYGRLTSGRGCNLKAHRVAFALANDGGIADERLVLHRCDNPSCCNPAHLFIGTPHQNTQDMIAKGRGSNGTPSYCGGC